MAASANPSGGGGAGGGGGNNGNNGTANGNANGNGSSGNNGVTSNGVAVPDNSIVGPTQAALRHNPGLSVEWTPEEQSLLEEMLIQFASETSIVRYARIAMQLKDKTVRDVALRCRWMTKKENSKRRKDDHNPRKSKDKKEKVTDTMPKSSQVANRSNGGPPYAQSMMPIENDDGISYKAIGGTTGQLLEQNAQLMDHISANFAAFKVHDNINLFCQARNTILTILNDFNDMPEIMKQMPPLPVKLNEDLANSILPRGNMPMKP